MTDTELLQAQRLSEESTGRALRTQHETACRAYRLMVKVHYTKIERKSPQIMDACRELHETRQDELEQENSGVGDEEQVLLLRHNGTTKSGVLGEGSSLFRLLVGSMPALIVFDFGFYASATLAADVEKAIGTVGQTGLVLLLFLGTASEMGVLMLEEREALEKLPKEGVLLTRVHLQMEPKGKIGWVVGISNHSKPCEATASSQLLQCFYDSEPLLSTGSCPAKLELEHEERVYCDDSKNGRNLLHPNQRGAAFYKSLWHSLGLELANATLVEMDAGVGELFRMHLASECATRKKNNGLLWAGAVGGSGGDLGRSVAGRFRKLEIGVKQWTEKQAKARRLQRQPSTTQVKMEEFTAQLPVAPELPHQLVSVLKKFATMTTGLKEVPSPIAINKGQCDATLVKPVAATPGDMAQDILDIVPANLALSMRCIDAGVVVCPSETVAGTMGVYPATKFEAFLYNNAATQ